MADLVQNVNGRWDITSLYHEFSENVEIPVTLKYNNEDPVVIKISNSEATSATTNWYTPLGEEIQTNTETALEEGTGITFTSQTVPANAGLCKISKITWLEVTPYIPPQPIVSYRFEVRPETYSASTSSGNYQYRSYFITITDGVESEQDVTASSTWSKDNAVITSITGGKAMYNNTSTTSPKTATVTATYTHNGVEYTDTAGLYVPKKAEEHVITYEVLVSGGGTMSDCEGTTSLTAYYITKDNGSETNRENITSTADWTSNNTNVATVNDNGVVTYNNEGTGTVSVRITATYNNRSDYVTVRVPACDAPEPVITHKLEITGSTDTIDSCEGTINLGALYYTYEDDEQVGEPTNVTINTDTTWSSSDTNIATVNNTGANKGKVTYHNTGETDATVTISATYNGYSNDFEITVPACASVEVDHCEVRASTYSIELNNGSKTITVSAVTYYTDGSSAYTMPSYHWEKRDGEFTPADEAYIANVATVVSASTGNGPYTFTVSVDGVYDITKKGTLVFKSPDCSNESAEVVARCTRIITYPTIYVSSNLDSSYGGMYGFHVVFSNLEASTKNITWKVSINNPIFTVRYTPDPNSSERTDMDSWPSIEFTGYTDETGLIGGYELVDDNLKSDLFPSQYISIGHESGTEEVFLWVKVPQETTLNFATLSNEREINNNVGGKSIGPIK